jgi:hypothetical protein
MVNAFPTKAPMREETRGFPCRHSAVFSTSRAEEQVRRHFICLEFNLNLESEQASRWESHSENHLPQHRAFITFWKNVGCESSFP